MRQGGTVSIKHSSYTDIRKDSRRKSHQQGNVCFKMYLSVWATTPCITQVTAVLSKGLKCAFCHSSRLQTRLSHTEEGTPRLLGCRAPMRLQTAAATGCAPPALPAPTGSHTAGARRGCCARGSPSWPRGDMNSSRSVRGDGPAAYQPRLCLTWVTLLST